MQFLLYCMCGAMGVSIDYAIFWFSVQSGIWYQGANALGYLAGTLMSFSLNRIVTFDIRDQIMRRLAIFISIAALGFATSALLLWLLVELFNLNAHVAKLVTLPMVVILQYSLNRCITFNVATGDPHSRKHPT